MEEGPDFSDRRDPTITPLAMAVVVTAGIAVALLSALVIFTDVIFRSGDDPSSSSSSSTQRWTDFNEPPWTSGIEVGKTYEYSVNAHCGVHSARIDGTNWRADPVLDDGMGNPPTGWAVLGGVGTLRILDNDTAVFSNGGRSVRFIRDELPDPRPCS